MCLGSNMTIFPRLLFIASCCTGWMISGAAENNVNQQPNMIIFIADDVSWDDFGCYGNSVVQTPNIDQLAANGICFTNAYLTASSCSPSRNSILLGRYPHNTGAAELHSAPPSNDVLSFPKVLKDAGYYTVASGKYHQGNYCLEAFDVISREYEKITNSGEGMWLQNVQDRPRDRPFFMWFAALDAHRDWGENSYSGTHDPADVDVPFYLADGEATREDLAHYYDEIYRFDVYVGKVVEELKKQGVYENTLLIIMADNGRPFPHSKTRVNDRGMKTPFILHWPEGVRQPAVCDGLVSIIDIAPTLLELAGLEADPCFQGVSFSRLLQHPQEAFRNHVFAEHNWHDYEAHERMVRNANFMYIRNSRPELTAIGPADSVSSPSHNDLVKLRKNGKLSASQNDIFTTPRAWEELYDLGNDPSQLHNLAGDPALHEPLGKMRAILDEWISTTGDTVPSQLTQDWYLREPGYIPTSQLEIRGEMPGEARVATQITEKGPF